MQTNSKDLNRRQIMKYALYGGLTAGLSSGLWLSGCRKRPGPTGPNIIFITIDTLRPDHMSCYGYHRNTSPNIDRFAEDAMLFENCFSHAPETRLSFASILSGFLPFETRIPQTVQLAKNVTVIPEILSSLGYETAAVMSNYVMRKKWGWGRGFRIYDDTMNQRELVRKWPEKTAENTTNGAIKILKRLADNTFFMWIHYQDPHGPYTPPQQYSKLFWDPADKEPRNIKVNKSLYGKGGIPSYQKLPNTANYHYYVSQYDAEIRYADTEFKRLIDSIKQLGLYDDSLIMFSSDHGEGMGEHNYYFAHGDYLYNHQTHVPLIIKHGSELRGKRTDFVQHLDIVPTLLNVAGSTSEGRFRGYDLRNPDAPQREIYAETRPGKAGKNLKLSLIYDGFKLIYTPFKKQHELFDIKADRWEEHDLIKDTKYLEKSKDMAVRLQRILNDDRLGLRNVSRPKKLTAEELEKFKSIGYIR